MNETRAPAVSAPSRSIATRAADPSEVLRVNPTLALFALLDDMNITLAEVRDELRQRPSGKIAVISDTQTDTNPTVVRVVPPWYGFVFTNDGPAPIELQVGDVNQWATIKTGEVLPVDMGGPVIDRIVLRVAASGQTAAYRLFGTY